MPQLRLDAPVPEQPQKLIKAFGLCFGIGKIRLIGCGVVAEHALHLHTGQPGKLRAFLRCRFGHREAQAAHAGIYRNVDIGSLL